MENLVDEGDVEALVGERQRMDVPVTDLPARGIRALELGACDREHLARTVDPYEPRRLTGYELEHAAGAGPQIYDIAQRPTR